MARASGRRRLGVAGSAGRGLLLAAALLVPHAAAARGHRADTEHKTPATEAYKQADARIMAANAAYRGALLPLLRSPDPYQRRLALDRLKQTGAVFDRDVQQALLPILEESALLPSETCAREPARCGEAPAVSNGMLAAQLRRSDVAPELLAAYIAARPAAADAVIAAGASLNAADLSKALPTTTHPAAQAALLRLALPSPCGHAMASPAVVALQESPDVAVRRLAALALLRTTGCRGPTDAAAEVRKRPLASVAARFADAADADIVADSVRLGEAAEPFVPQLLARLQRSPGNDRERGLILETLAAVGKTPAAKAAVPQLYRMLRDPAQRPLRGAVLSALIAAWPHQAPEAKPALIALTAAEPERFTKALTLLWGSGARVSAAEFARLEASYRKGCLSDSNDACGAASGALSALARAAKLPFRPLGHDRNDDDHHHDGE